MRIALTSPYAWPEVARGGERYFHELAAALSRAGHEVVALAGAPRGGRSAQLGVPVRTLTRRPLLRHRYGELAGEVGFAAAVLPRVAAARVDLWHATGTAEAAAAVALARVRPRLGTVFTDHGFPARASRATRPDAGLHRRVVEGVASYVCVSEAAGSFLRSDYGREPVVIPPGVELKRYRTDAARSAAPVLLFVGALDVERKGLALLLEATALLAARVPTLELWLLGPGEAGPVLAAAPVAARERVTRVGLAGPGELALAYARAWVTVLPSTAESFGMVLVESLASGTPVVALRNGGGPAEVVRAGTGLLADPSAAGLADACEQALELAGQPQVRAACRHRAADFDWDTVVVPRLEEVYGA